MRRLVVLPLLLISAGNVAAATPVAGFTNFATYQEVKISPRGTYLALTRRMGNQDVLTVLKLPALSPASQSQFGDLTDISTFRWANDTRILISPERRFPGSTAYKVPTGEIIGIDADGKNAELIFGYDAGKMQTGTKIAQRVGIQAAAEMLDVLPADTDNVLIQTYGYGMEGEFNAAYRMHVGTGKLTKVASSPLRNGTFLTDLNHRVALVAGADTAGDYHVYYRANESSEWKQVSSSKQFSGGLGPVGPIGNDTFLVLDNSDAPTDGAFTWNPVSGERRLLYRNPSADLQTLGTDTSGAPWGFIYTDHFPQYWYPDPEHPLARTHRMLRGIFKDSVIRITSQTDDLSMAVARVSAARFPPVFLVVDVKNQKVLQALQSYPELKPGELGSVEPIEFRARDGLSIRGYLTTPNVADKKKLPLVVLVHGGPHSVYDDYDYDFERQLLASRGYAVLQVNYRGSGGRGMQFGAAGYGRWGREMQDDITDGVKWAIQDGVADAARICIFGASYGAYAALTGAFREPALFRCAIGMSGVYDLPLMFDKGDIRSIDSGVNYLKQAVGTDTEELRRRSPVYNAESIRAAVLLLHGKDDERAPFEHALRLKAALEAAKHPPEWFTEWGEGHGFYDEKNRAAAYERILGFLAKHIGGQAP